MSKGQLGLLAKSYSGERRLIDFDREALRPESEHFGNIWELCFENFLCRGLVICFKCVILNPGKKSLLSWVT